MHNKYKLYVISHTHWDREWYQTFQEYRRRLVRMMDDLLQQLETNEDYKYFHMDGQTVVLEDYIAIRPENEERLRDLIKKGRIIIGPWYNMPDEFLICGESIVRNLQKGYEISRSYGVEPMKCGYVVDIFGHNSQFPQILNGFGINSAVLFRGIGDYPKDTFMWSAADGSSVLCAKIDRNRSYSNFYFALRWPFEGREYNDDEAVKRMKELLEYSKDMAVTENILMMDGVDHIDIEPQIPQILAMLNENIDGIEIKHSTIEEFINEQLNSGVEFDEIKGELYSVGEKGINNQLLKNVLSSIVHLKQANSECENLLTRWAEPFDAAASFLKKRDDQGFIKEAWKELMLNHPHDSICGCSITRVHMDNEYRFNQVRDIANGVIESSLEDISANINTSATGKSNNIVLFNAGQKNFAGVVEADLEFPSGSQGNFKLFDSEGNEVPYQILDHKKGVTKKIVKFRELINFIPKDIFRIAFNASIPSVGYSTYGYEEYRTIFPEHGDYTFKEFHAPTRYRGTMQTGHRTWENEYITLSIKGNGTLSVFNKATGKIYSDLLIFEDCADIGDGYNYRKPIKDSRYLCLNGRFDLAIESDGPLAARIKLTHYLNLPANMDSNGIERSGSTKEFKIITLVEMRKGSPRLDFKTFIDNNVGEHRLRVLFPSYIETDSFFASTPYYLEERKIQKPDTSSFIEIDTGVYPNQGVVLLKDSNDCLALYNKGLYEIEITEDESHTMALTLFRSYKNEVGGVIGELSFMYRSMCFEYALQFAAGETPAGDIMVSGEDWKTGIKSECTDSHAGKLACKESFLEVNVPGAVLSAFKTGKEGLTILRLYNCTGNDTEGFVKLYNRPDNVFLLNLNEEVIEEADFEGNNIPLMLKAGQIICLGIN